jgi:hypothetical protein
VIGYLYSGSPFHVHLEDGTNSGMAVILENKVPATLEIYLGDVSNRSK